MTWSFTLPDVGRNISRNIASLNIFAFHFQEGFYIINDHIAFFHENFCLLYIHKILFWFLNILIVHWFTIKSFLNAVNGFYHILLNFSQQLTVFIKKAFTFSHESFLHFDSFLKAFSSWKLFHFILETNKVFKTIFTKTILVRLRFAFFIWIGYWEQWNLYFSILMCPNVITPLSIVYIKQNEK